MFTRAEGDVKPKRIKQILEWMDLFRSTAKDRFFRLVV